MALAVGLLLSSSGPLQAQEAGPIMYAENGMDPVATYTAVDPEGESIVWSVVGEDMDDFSIKTGVLRFKSSPDFESPRGGVDNSNTYEVTVQAGDGGADTTAMEQVTIEVTNVEEPGTVTLSTLQPQVGVPITATLTDPDTIENAGSDHRHLAVVQGQQRDRRRDRWRRHDHVLLHSHDRGRRQCAVGYCHVRRRRGRR